jgi:hypothetical protein
MIKKNQLKETIESFPDEFTLEELVDKLILLDKIEKGNRDSIEGNTLSEVELEEEMKKWFKYSGPISRLRAYRTYLNTSVLTRKSTRSAKLLE